MMAFILIPRAGLATGGDCLDLLRGCLAVEQECDCCGKQMELDSAYQYDAKRL